jgi:hypothetical protein
MQLPDYAIYRAHSFAMVRRSRPHPNPRSGL